MYIDVLITLAVVARAWLLPLAYRVHNSAAMLHNNDERDDGVVSFHGDRIMYSHLAYQTDPSNFVSRPQFMSDDAEVRDSS